MIHPLVDFEVIGCGFTENLSSDGRASCLIYFIGGDPTVTDIGFDCSETGLIEGPL